MRAALTEKREFQFDDTSRDGYVVARGGDLDQYPGAHVAIEVDPDDPNTVNIWIRGGQNLFDGYRSMKARAYGLKDPAGNHITVTNADINIVSNSI
jgi:hypothetical protein